MLKIDSINLIDEEKAKAIKELESDTESKLNTLNQFMHDSLLNISHNDRVALLVGMIMAAQGVADKITPLKLDELKGQEGQYTNDGQIFLNKIKDFLSYKNLPQEKINLVINDLEKAFIYSKLYNVKSYTNELLHSSDESPLKKSISKCLIISCHL